MFKKLDGDVVILRSGGVFRQCDLYSRADGLYARYGTGFIRLNRDGSTSAPKIQIDTLIYDGPLFQDRFGRLFLTAGTDSKPVTDRKLLEGPNHADH